MLGKKDYSISFVRMLATGFIVLCHFMQFHNWELAWWFNVGVQMFLFLSGYLYGKKKELDPADFYVKSYKKILVDHYLYVFLIVIVMLLIGRVSLTVRSVARFLVFLEPLDGLEHFWFIPYILFCYFITPIIRSIAGRINQKSGPVYLLQCLLLLAGVEIAIRFFFIRFEPAWINCYVLGVLVAGAEKKGKTWKTACILLALGCLLMNGLQIYVDYVAELKFGRLKNLYSDFCNYAHVLLGVSLVLGLRWVYRKLDPKAGFITKFLDWSDTYSYDIYIVHQFFILGPHSVMSISSVKIAGVLTASALIVVSALILHWLATWLRKKIPLLR